MRCMGHICNKISHRNGPTENSEQRMEYVLNYKEGGGGGEREGGGDRDL
jgi:hypothetical protein